MPHSHLPPRSLFLHQLHWSMSHCHVVPTRQTLFTPAHRPRRWHLALPVSSCPGVLLLPTSSLPPFPCASGAAVLNPSNPNLRAAGAANRRSRSHERLPVPRGHDPPLLGPRPPPQDLRHQVVLRCVEEDAGAVHAGVRGEVPGPLHGLHLALQLGDEGGVHLQLRGDRVVHAPPPTGAENVRQGAGHLPPCGTRSRRMPARADIQRAVHLPRDMLGILNLFGGSGNFTAVSVTPEKQECGQLNWTIYFLPRVHQLRKLESESINLLIVSYRAYRAFYILNWIYRYFTEGHHSRWIPWLAGLVQTALYADFFYYYFLSWKNNVKLELPA